jgi:probable HAF family extracellular repeat protein
VSISYPGAQITGLLAINDRDMMVGSYYDTQFIQYGIIYKNRKFDVVTYPGASGTLLTGVNDSGQVVGVGEFPNERSNHSFIYQGGKFRQISISNAVSIAVGGINNAGDISGWYQTGTGGATKGFLGEQCH